ncbi:hypothetical protein [Streptomyces sp. NP-1717]|uniref:hypothetical protein n=1 Tax=unclassified Streptomyces TaxID=2593676 RepID=UPI001F5CC4C5|nr:hypothetical protein [Streptomyces sp. NP-1717]MCI3226334.1 hypothetical protein [Streptomyces sp. NP-1717]WTA74300.1 hypothetical protein OG705_16210 [Streptomyces sp. NBC_00838]
MSNPYQPAGASPYVNAPMPNARPRMYASTPAKVIWTLVPIITISFGAAIPFVVAAAKGVVKTWVAVAYAVTEVAFLSIAMLAAPEGDNPFVGLLLILLIATSATHTALLDNDKVTIGK